MNRPTSFTTPIFSDVKTLTLKHDVLNTGDLTDIQTTMNRHGDKARLDAMTMNGRANSNAKD
jgi:hypothetical protein